MDIKMPGQNGLEVLRQTQRARPQGSGYPDDGVRNHGDGHRSDEVRGLRLHPEAFRYPQMKGLVERALEVSRMMKKVVALPDQKEGEVAAESIVGSSPAMQEIYKMIGQVAPTDVTVLLRGESGTGKEMVARAISSPQPAGGPPLPPGELRGDSGDALGKRAFRTRKGRLHRSPHPAHRKV